MESKEVETKAETKTEQVGVQVEKKVVKAPNRKKSTKKVARKPVAKQTFLSESDKHYIRQYKSSLSVEELSSAVDESVNDVKKYVHVLNVEERARAKNTLPAKKDEREGESPLETDVPDRQPHNYTAMTPTVSMQSDNIRSRTRTNNIKKDYIFKPME